MTGLSADSILLTIGLGALAFLFKWMFSKHWSEIEELAATCEKLRESLAEQKGVMIRVEERLHVGAERLLKTDLEHADTRREVQRLGRWIASRSDTNPGFKNPLRVRNDEEGEGDD